MEYLFRGISKSDKKWIYGDLVHVDGDTYIFNDYTYEEGRNSPDRSEVIPGTVGLLRYSNEYGRYFDGDVYYHAGHGHEIVSELCELHQALLFGNNDDISAIIGNIHDNPELINK